jgi:hypothetical protein
MTIDITTIADTDRDRAWAALVDAIEQGVKVAIAAHRDPIEAAGLFLNAHDLRGQLEELLEDARDLN